MAVPFVNRNTDKKDSSGNQPANQDKTTTKKIALGLLWTFIIFIFTLLLVNIFVNRLLAPETTGNGNDTNGNLEFKKGWFDLLKNGFVLLGTTLTTIIGYYFGQREGTIKAEAEKKEAAKQAEDTDNRAQEVVINAIKQRDEAIRDNVNKKTSETDIAPTDQNSNDITIPS